MGRKKCDIVRQYFQQCEDTNKLGCKIDNCRSIISDHATNLLKHMEINHPNEFSQVMMRKVQKRPHTGEPSNLYNEYIKKTKFDVMDACIRLVSVHGRPFSLMDDEAFRDIINMLPKESQRINSHNVRHGITQKAITIKNKIKSEIKGKLISVKIDAATCMNRSFIGINIQFIKGNKVQIRTLGVIELFESHSAEYLKNVIVNTCKKFDISTKQIYTVTIDNAANMIKIVRILNENENENDNENENNVADNPENIDYNDIGLQIEDVLLNTNDHTSENASEFIRQPNFTIMAIRCAAHTLQLAMNDLLKNEKVASIVNRARQVVKKLRTPLIKSALFNICKKSAILDCVTRWHSTVDMLERLNELKHYFEVLDDEDLKLSPSFWMKIAALIDILKPARIATKRLQSEQLLFGDLYEIWKRCYIEIKNNNNEFRNELLNNMEKRENMLQNDTFLAGIFVDPRYNVILTDEQIRIAKNRLLQTYARIEMLNTTVEQIGIRDDIIQQIPGEVDDFEILLQDAETVRGHKTTRNKSNYIIEFEIDDFLKEPRLKSSTDVLSFCKNRDINRSGLRKIAEVVLAVPPTQVTVERLFSTLKFILSAHRSKLTSDIIDDILIIRLNNIIIDDNCINSQDF